MVGVGATDGAEPDADAGGEVALVVAGERPRDVDGLVAVPAEERPVLHAEDERRLLLADVAAREGGGERGVEREALVLAGELVGGVDLDVAARAQRRLMLLHLCYGNPRVQSCMTIATSKHNTG